MFYDVFKENLLLINSIIFLIILLIIIIIVGYFYRRIEKNRIDISNLLTEITIIKEKINRKK